MDDGASKSPLSGDERAFGFSPRALDKPRGRTYILIVLSLFFDKVNSAFSTVRAFHAGMDGKRVKKTGPGDRPSINHARDEKSRQMPTKAYIPVEFSIIPAAGFAAAFHVFSRILPFDCRPSMASCAALAMLSGNSRSMVTVSLPSR